MARTKASLCEKFRQDPAHNPETGRPMTINKGVYNKLQRTCNTSSKGESPLSERAARGSPPKSPRSRSPPQSPRARSPRKLPQEISPIQSRREMTSSQRH